MGETNTKESLPLSTKENVLIGERAQLCSCSIEISDMYIYICIYMYIYIYVYIYLYICGRTSSYMRMLISMKSCAGPVVRNVGELSFNHFL